MLVALPVGYLTRRKDDDTHLSKRVLHAKLPGAHVREQYAQQVRYADKDNDATNRTVGVISQTRVI